MVTIYGESAGAGSVEIQVIATNTQPPLFQGAMASSGFSPAIYAYNDYVVEVSS